MQVPVSSGASSLARANDRMGKQRREIGVGASWRKASRNLESTPGRTLSRNLADRHADKL